jgi:ubiquinone/menaquinone biosynthesis C-methylase UbiE
MNEFDSKALEWDKNPMHWDRSEAIANEIIKLIPLNRNMSALEFGAGTGITSFLLKDKLKEIILMDNSTEMVKVMNNKIRASNVTNLKTLYFDLEHEDYEGGKFDLIFTQMVLHHVINVENIIEKFSKLLRKDGYLAIADLYTEDGSFHGEGFEGHRGFDAAELSKTILKYSFNDISHKKCFVIDRKTSETENRQYPVFLIIARSKNK